MAVHAHFFYPWTTSRFSAAEEDDAAAAAALQTQIATSSSTLAEAARKIILAVRLVDANATTPSWLAVDYPVYALVNLSVYILKYPTLQSAPASLSLLHVCAGHLGYLEFLTSGQISVSSLAREAASLASNVVKAARAKNSVPASVENTTTSSRHHTGHTSTQTVGANGGINLDDPEHESSALTDVRFAPAWVCRHSLAQVMLIPLLQ
jgi:hypothetical protein